MVGLRGASQDGINGTMCEWGEMLLDCSTAFLWNNLSRFL